MLIRICHRQVIISVLLGLGLVVALCTSCATPSSGYLTPFSQNGKDYNGGQWSPGGQWFAAPIFNSNTIQLFTPTGQAVNTLQTGCGPFSVVRYVAWLPDGRVSCFWSNEPPVLEVITLNQHAQVEKQEHLSIPIIPGTSIYDMQWNPHHDWLATIAESSPGNGLVTFLYLSDLAGHNLITPLRGNAASLAWSSDGTRLAVVQRDGTIVVYQVEQQTPGRLTMIKLHILVPGTSPGDTITWSPSGHWIVCRHGTFTGEDYLFLLATDGSGKQVKITSSTTDGQLDYPAWSPDGKQLIVGRVSDNSLMSLNIQVILKEKNVEP